jgi:hypothetical protein
MSNHFIGLYAQGKKKNRKEMDLLPQRIKDLNQTVALLHLALQLKKKKRRRKK